MQYTDKLLILLAVIIIIILLINLYKEYKELARLKKEDDIARNKYMEALEKELDKLKSLAKEK